MSDAGIVAALEGLAHQGQVEAIRILDRPHNPTKAQIAERCVASARRGQVVALRALKAAGELDRR